MRLLRTEECRTGNFEVLEFTDDRIPPYAILSHTWEGGEVTFQDIQAGDLQMEKKGYEKIKRCCHLARAEDFEYVWIDSCCIDKTSSAELSEAINSMYRWYQEAGVCYAYLADVPSRKGFEESRWFTRGWTLQELIAPRKLVFLDEEWKELGSKAGLQQIISERTRIPIDVLSGDDDIESFSIAQRMSWAAERSTTRVEDLAYSLLGIFGVNMPLIYGERETAFIRLQEEIMRISDDHSLFAWRSPDNRGGLLATSPAAFIGSQNIVRYNPFDAFNIPFTATSTGINLKIRFMGIGPRGLGLVILHCKEETEGGKLVALYVRDSVFLTMERFERVHSDSFQQLDPRRFRPTQYPMRDMSIQAGRLARYRKSKDWGNFESTIPNIYPDVTLLKLMRFEEPSTLLQAAEQGLEDRVWLLLTRSDIEGDQKGPGELTPLMHAAKEGHVKIVKILVARHDVNADTKDDQGWTALCWAAQAGHEAIIKVLIEKGVAVDGRERVGLTPLAIASVHGHEGVAKLLLDKSAATEVPDQRGKTALQHAALKGHEPIIKVLLQGGANIDARDKEGQSPLSCAIFGGYEAVSKVLLENGADLHVGSKIGLNFLLYGASSKSEALLKMLLEKGANIDAQDATSQTALFLAARDGKHAVARLLLKHGADVDIRDCNGNTPIAIAKAKGQTRIVMLLREMSARSSRASRKRALFW